MLELFYNIKYNVKNILDKYLMMHICKENM